MAEALGNTQPTSGIRIDRIRTLFDRIRALNEGWNRPEGEDTTKAMDALIDEFGVIADEVWRQPVIGWDDIVERALLSWHYASGGGDLPPDDDPSLYHAERTHNHLIRAVLSLDDRGGCGDAPHGGIVIPLARRDAIDEQLDKLDWLISVTDLASDYLEGAKPGGWRLIQNVLYLLSGEITATRAALLAILDAPNPQAARPHAVAANGAA